MNQALAQYIEKARAKGHKDDRIKQDLIDAGWDAHMVIAGLKGEDDDGLVPPPPPPGSTSRQPQSVVQNLSTRGLEYIITAIALAVAAFSLGSLLHSNVNNLLGNGDTGFSGSTIAFAAAALIVSFPVLTILFFRLKKAESLDPDLHHDPSRKHVIQLTLLGAFVVGLGNIIFFVYNLMTGGTDRSSYNVVGSQAANGLLGNAIHLLITLAIAGGIFAYYWFDEHRKA